MSVHSIMHTFVYIKLCVDSLRLTSKGHVNLAITQAYNKIMFMSELYMRIFVT